VRNVSAADPQGPVCPSPLQSLERLLVLYAAHTCVLYILFACTCSVACSRSYSHSSAGMIISLTASLLGQGYQNFSLPSLLGLPVLLCMPSSGGCRLPSDSARHCNARKNQPEEVLLTGLGRNGPVRCLVKKKLFPARFACLYFVCGHVLYGFVS
jgi:hypothetical protein